MEAITNYHIPTNKKLCMRFHTHSTENPIKTLVILLILKRTLNRHGLIIVTMLSKKSNLFWCGNLWCFTIGGWWRYSQNSVLLKKLYKYQKMYSTMEKECLALLLALQNVQVYLSVSLRPIHWSRSSDFPLKDGEQKSKTHKVDSSSRIQFNYY